jgi:hypothetical protein
MILRQPDHNPDTLSSFILGQSMIVRHVTFPIKPPPL